MFDCELPWDKLKRLEQNIRESAKQLKQSDIGFHSAYFAATSLTAHKVGK
tara:strand:+ start:1867 stop:2016 length:150 start_codon:yes stop_codon:yes gene_type:complete